jgi:hypothetical protein
MDIIQRASTKIPTISFLRIKFRTAEARPQAISLPVFKLMDLYYLPIIRKIAIKQQMQITKMQTLCLNLSEKIKWLRNQIVTKRSKQALLAQKIIKNQLKKWTENI